MKNFLIALPLDLHAKLKATAALKRMTMLQFILDAISEKIDRESK